MKRSGFKMKGYSYPGSSPIKQTTTGRKDDMPHRQVPEVEAKGTRTNFLQFLTSRKAPSGGTYDPKTGSTIPGTTNRERSAKKRKSFGGDLSDFVGGVMNIPKILADEVKEIGGNISGSVKKGVRNYKAKNSKKKVTNREIRKASKLNSRNANAGITDYTPKKKKVTTPKKKKVTDREIRGASKANARNANAGITNFYTEKQVTSKDFDSSAPIKPHKTIAQKLGKGAENLYAKSNKKGKLTDAVMAAGITAVISRIGRQKTKEPIVSSTEAGGFSKINIMGGRKKKKA